MSARNRLLGVLESNVRDPIRLKAQFIRWRASLRGRGIIGRLEAPKGNQRVAAWVDIKGWAFTPEGYPVNVRTLIDGQPTTEVVASGPRPDVAAVFSDLAPAARCGFDSRVIVKNLPETFVLKVDAIAEPIGRAKVYRRTLGIRRCKRVTDSTELQGRGNYSKVWDEAARSAISAQISVCGTPDRAEFERSGESTAETIITQTGIGPRDVVLEIGCGTGRVGVKLAPRCGQWIGADASGKMIEYAREATKGMSNVAFRLLNGHDLGDIQDAAIDVVYCSAVFMHLDEWDRYRYVVEAFRVLRPAGRIYFDNFNLLGEEGWKLFLDLCEMDPGARPANISKSSTPEELGEYARRAGFVDVRVLPGPLWLAVTARKPHSQENLIE